MANTSENAHQKPHILVFPYPAQGHFLPILDLTHQLSLRNLAITILVTPKNKPSLNPLLSIHPTIQILVLPFPSHPKLPAGVENVREIGNKGNLPIINALGKLHDPLIKWFKSHQNPPVAIISDFFLGWTLNLAQQLNISRIAFFSSGAYFTAIVHCLYHNLYVQSGPSIEFPDIPGSPSIQEDHLPSIYRVCRELVNSDTEFITNCMLANTESWGCVFNSFDDLEGLSLNYLKTKMGHSRVYGVGPLSLIGVADSSVWENPNPDLNTDVLKWLDGCPHGSVVYVCFGSQKLLNRQQMEGLAWGLEASMTKFIWVVKTGTTQQVENGYDIIPSGFEERIGERGLVIRGWAPQVSILSHQAVGGFLSHCGWNSILEGIVAGVTILGWPMEADQFVNSKLLVEEMRVGVRVCEGADAVPDPNELAKIIAETMSSEASEKVRAKELKDKAFTAVKNGGSSLRGLDEFVKQLRMLPIGKE